MAKNISFTIKFWRQNGPKDAGHFDSYDMKDIPDDTSFLEMLDILNENLINEGKEPFVFDHDCREGICGMCSLYINGTPHGKTERGATTCQLYMRRFNDGDVITVEPWRSAAFPVIKDCMVDRNAFDKIIQAGGYTTIRTGQAQDANAILIPKEDADEAMDCASCIGCGACVAACKNGSAMLFVSSKVSQLALLPQGRVEAARRVKNMIAKMDELGGCMSEERDYRQHCPPQPRDAEGQDCRLRKFTLLIIKRAPQKYFCGALFAGKQARGVNANPFTLPSRCLRCRRWWQRCGRHDDGRG